MADKTETKEFFQKTAEQNVERMSAMMDEFAKAESGARDQMDHQIDEMARLWKQSLSYSMELNGHMRQMMFDATRRTMNWMVQPKF